jgi:protein kinase C substrate 80K-H
VLAGLAKQRVEELRDALISVVSKRDALKEKVKELETILSTFKEEYNPNFNDEGVKRAVKSWEDYAAKNGAAGESDDSAEDRDIENISKPDSETEGINWAEFETEEETDVDARMWTRQYGQD